MQTIIQLLAVLALASLATVNASFIRPPELIFLSPSDTVYPAEQPEIFAGLSAAFKEANDADLLGGTKLVAQLVDVTSTVTPIVVNGDTAAMEATLVSMLSQDNVMGFAANSQLTSYAIIPTVNKTVRDALNFAINSPAPLTDFANVVNLRGFINVELPILIDFAYMRDGLHCTDFFILHIYMGDLTGIKKQFERNGFGESAWMERGVTDAPDIAELFTKFYNNGKPHSCIMLFDISTAVIPIVQALKTLPFFVPGTPILAISFSYVPVFPTPANFGDLYISQVVPSPTDIDSTFVQRYRSAMTSYLSTANSTNSMGLAVAGVPNYQSMEGYIAGRVIVDAAKGTMNLTRKNLLETVYRQRMFKFEDFSLGPYTDGCTMDGTFPCQCTAGLRSVYMSRVDSTTGQSYLVTDRPELGEVLVSTRTAPTSVCLDGPVVTRRAFNILFHVASTTADYPSATAEPNRRLAVDRFFYAFRNATFTINNSTSFRDLGSIRIVTQPFATVDTLTLPAIQAQYNRYRPFAIAGLPFEVNNESLVAPVLSQPLMGLSLTGPKLNLSSSYVPIEVFASLADHIHALVAYGANQERLGMTIVLADTAEALMYAQKSFETFGASLPSASGVVSDASRVAHLLQSGFSILLASQTESIVTAAVAAAASHSLTAAGKESLLVAAEESTIYYAAVGFRSTLTTPIYFASILPMWWSSTTVFGNIVASKGVLKTSETSKSESPATAKAVYTAQFLFEVALLASAIYDAENRVPSLSDTLFASKTVNVVGTTLGPFSNTSCNSSAVASNPQRQCQCGKGPRTINIHSMNDLLAGRVTNTMSKGFFAQLQGCGISYLPLPSSSTSDSTAVIAGAVGGGGALLLLCMLSVILVVCCSGKSNGAAPKNEQKPFAMVFTDIESSTTLWARDPMGMGAAIDIHHTVLRKALRRNKGYEVKIIGDSFMVAFEQVVDATRFALEIQSTLYDSQWPNGNMDDTYLELHESDAHMNDGAASMSFTTKSSHQVYGDVSPRVLSGPAPDFSSPISPDIPSLATGNSNLKAPSAMIEVPSTKANPNDIQTLKRNWKGLRVRVGVHFGTGRIQKDLVSGGYDYYGTVVNTAARVEGVGHGGQVLVTEAVVEELYPGLSKRLAPAANHPVEDLAAILLPLGPQPLRGLQEPIALYQMLPTRFAERTFGPLRLDCENAVEEDDAFGNNTNTHSDAQSERVSTVNGTEDPGLRAATTVAKEGGDEKQFLLHYQLLRTLFSASEAKWRGRTLEALAADWKVKLPSAKKQPQVRAVDGAIAEVLKRVFKVAAESLNPKRRGRRNSTQSLSYSQQSHDGGASTYAAQHHHHQPSQPIMGVKVDVLPNTVITPMPTTSEHHKQSKAFTDNNQASSSNYASQDEQMVAVGPTRSDGQLGTSGRYA